MNDEKDMIELKGILRIHYMHVFLVEQTVLNHSQYMRCLMYNAESTQA